jgi:alpha-ribazole phosphatase
MNLLLIRHARTAAADGLCYGCSDIPAPPEATQSVARDIAPRLPADALLVSSPLSRCTALAQALIALRPDLRMTLDPRIAEMDFGAWEQRRWSDIDRREFDAWTHGFPHARAGGCGESLHLFLHRVGLAYDEWQTSGRDAIWITHAGVIRAVWLLQGGIRTLSRADQWPRQPRCL